MSLTRPVYSHCDTHVFKDATDVYLRVAFSEPIGTVYIHAGIAIVSEHYEYELDAEARRLHNFLSSYPSSTNVIDAINVINLQTFIISKPTLMAQIEVVAGIAKVYSKEEFTHLLLRIKNLIESTRRPSLPPS